MKFIVDTKRTSVEQNSVRRNTVYRSKAAQYRAEGQLFKEYLGNNPRLQKQLRDILES